MFHLEIGIVDYISIELFRVDGAVDVGVKLGSNAY